MTIDELIEKQQMMSTKGNVIFSRHPDIAEACNKEHLQIAECLKELKEYQQMEEEGLLKKFPCKVGDTVYSIARNERVVPSTVHEIKVSKYGLTIVASNEYGGLLDFYDQDQSSTWFLTEEEAEESLQELKKELEKE